MWAAEMQMERKPGFSLGRMFIARIKDDMKSKRRTNILEQMRDTIKTPFLRHLSGSRVNKELRGGDRKKFLEGDFT